MALDEIQAESIQAAGRGEVEGTGLSLLTMFAAVGAGIAPWWSRQRDTDLRQFYPTCPHLAGALYTIAEKLCGVPLHVEPRDPDIRSHWQQAEHYENNLLEQSQFGLGWDEFFKRMLLDYWTQDNGMFAEVIGGGPKDGPIQGPALGLAHLDAGRCIRSGNPEYPVVYIDTDGKYYRLHHTRVLYRAQLPASPAEMHGVGLCWTSRCLSVAQGLTDVLRYKQEKLGSRPLRALLIGRGIAPDQVVAAVQVAEETANSRAQQRFARYPVLGNPTRADIGLDVVDLASLPDGFNYSDDLTLGIYSIALAGGFPARWLWPATVEGATKADALYQHMAGQTSGIGGTLRTMALLLGGNPAGTRSVAAKFLPPYLKLVFDFQDDEQDRASADIASTRSITRRRNVESGALDERTAREQMLEQGEITDAQFADLELAAGRLEDGTDVRLALYQDNPLLAGLLPAPPDPAVVAQRRDAAQQVLATTSLPKMKRAAKEALACLAAWAAPVAPPAPEPAPELAPEPLREPEPAGAKGRKQAGGHEAAVAAYQAELLELYQDWAAEAAAELAAVPPEERAATLEALLLVLAWRLREAGRRHLTAAFDLGRAGARPTPADLAALEAAIARNAEFITTSYLPAVRRRFQDDAQEPDFAWQEEPLGAALGALAGRTQQYGGAFWAAIGLGAAALLRRQDDPPVRRELDPHADHCPDCPGLVGEYESWDTMAAAVGLPGDGSTQCRGNCRCQIYARIRGIWQRVL